MGLLLSHFSNSKNIDKTRRPLRRPRSILVVTKCYQMLHRGYMVIRPRHTKIDSKNGKNTPSRTNLDLRHYSITAGSFQCADGIEHLHTCKWTMPHLFSQPPSLYGDRQLG